ncbi:hypothetical protein EYF80_043058 [Liparis tanakae]|uniref:Uncharacterized protein n=1 Tax=Liparis tanakae TaxID=230148 RepID=A0A4Z2G0U3_9TELE|nr:hypothetical protein EYF80_043058 [Liparis tanakae]
MAEAPLVAAAQAGVICCLQGRHLAEASSSNLPGLHRVHPQQTQSHKATRKPSSSRLQCITTAPNLIELDKSIVT